jgi:hypothetical protein
MKLEENRLLRKLRKSEDNIKMYLKIKRMVWIDLTEISLE